ncbi:hypothetical protein NPA07_02655 [Mycoplasmopsis caviae]|uniref:Methylase-associated X1 domain-containing protein n=2 Tax=Mycoplasmopsis caviae TaxID=55603 RepID=A0A3P8LBE8_9BACT|nr:hypothetical protein [Mycoplasmopsis caviae]UUD35752.1 hypothetical protein NPA07_02655 [Mycoplasmopsis caviae]VDR42401.1 Uncharacterised protein [Mycoplasmopsis caviae]
MYLIPEQLLPNNQIEYAYDTCLTKKETKNILQDIFGSSLSTEKIEGKDVFICSGLDKKVILLTSQISYLGNPHPIYKKRVQLKKWFLDIFNYASKFDNFDVKFIGIYRYRDNVLFVDFEKDKYINKKMHNSSAHVYTNDLYKGNSNGIFTKYDKNKNLIHIISKKKFKDYILNNEKPTTEEYELIELIDDFNKNHFDFNKWIEVQNAVLEMKNNNFPKWKECEWPAFYLEYKFSCWTILKYINKYIKYLNNEFKNRKLDFDISFPNSNFFGDLKASDIKKLDAMLNDAENIEYELEQYGKLWYLIYEHDTIKDKNLDNYPFTKKRLETIRIFEPDYKKRWRTFIFISLKSESQI